MRAIRRVIIHCSATKPNMDIGVKEIRGWHVAQGWQREGYHHVIRRDGTVEEGRPHALIGAHTKGENADSLGICVVGGIDKDGKPEANFTPAQWASLERLVWQLVARYPGIEVSGHNNWTTAKACPCFDARTWWKIQSSESDTASSTATPD